MWKKVIHKFFLQNKNVERRVFDQSIFSLFKIYLHKKPGEILFDWIHVDNDSFLVKSRHRAAYGYSLSTINIHTLVEISGAGPS